MSTTMKKIKSIFLTFCLSIVLLSVVSIEASEGATTQGSCWGIEGTITDNGSCMNGSFTMTCMDYSTGFQYLCSTSQTICESGVLIIWSLDCSIVL